jgi:membrane protein DedA with SNARE-associated domain
MVIVGVLFGPTILGPVHKYVLVGLLGAAEIVVGLPTPAQVGAVMVGMIAVKGCTNTVSGPLPGIAEQISKPTLQGP